MTEYEQRADSDRRFLIWEISGGVVAFIAVVVLIMIAGTVVSRRGEEIARAKAVAEANRPVDAVNVALLRLKKVDVHDRIVLPGLLEAWERADVSSQVAGEVISKVPEGAKVRKGDLLLQIDEKDYAIRLTDTKASFEKAEQNYLRKQKLRTSQVNSLSELEEASALYNKAKSDYEAAKLALERCRVLAPFDGVVDVVNPEVGELVASGTKVATVAQLGDLKAEVGIPEMDIDLVRNVQKCDVAVEATGLTVEGQRTYLSYLPVSGAQVYKLRLKLPNPTGALRPGMFGNVMVVRQVRQNFLAPIYAVMVKDDQYYVFVADQYAPPPGKEKDPRNLQLASKRTVSLGVVQGSDVEILSGLREGDRLVVVGQRNLDDGTVINVVKEGGSIGELKE